MMITQTASTSTSAILYAIRELARRAGASPAEIERWRVEIAPHTVTISPEPASSARIVFATDRSKPQRLEALLERRPSHYGWMHDPPEHLRDLVPDFVVPFEDDVNDGPLFVAIGADEIRCRGDIITATLWMLSRTDEWGVHVLDDHGRFRADASVAARNGFLERPIVDEYGLAFAQALKTLVPRWHGRDRMLRVKLSHDIDHVGYPRRPRGTAALLLRHRNAGAFFTDAASYARIGRPAHLGAVERLAQLSRARAIDSAFYFKATTRPTLWDSGYDPALRAVRDVILQLQREGFEIGIHPGYETFHSQALLDAEVRVLRSVAGSGPMGGRQHYLRWDPSTWVAWERAGLSYDSTLGYAESMGFRAGTCLPYHPWSSIDDRELALLEIPLIVMDRTPVEYMGLSNAATLQRVDALIARCRAVGGVFTLLWHNNSLVEPPYTTLYPQLLDRLSHQTRFDWRSECAIAPLPNLSHATR